ncbi:UTRA domain-containing protein, partial [Staphylococcus xylosus]
DEYGELKQNNDLSIYKILEDEQIEIKDIEDNFSVDFNEQATAYLSLQTSDPLLVRERISYSVNYQIVEYSIGYYNSKLKKYSISLKG